MDAEIQEIRKLRKKYLQAIQKLGFVSTRDIYVSYEGSKIKTTIAVSVLRNISVKEAKEDVEWMMELYRQEIFKKDNNERTTDSI